MFFDIFGEDVIAKITEKKIGITMNVLKKRFQWLTSVRSNLFFVSAFAGETNELFPGDEETEKLLLVPTLDGFIGNCLVKRHDRKAFFYRKELTLTAFQNARNNSIQSAAGSSFMGIAICMYMQQSGKFLFCKNY